jgi:acyl-CoA thioesterase-1
VPADFTRYWPRLRRVNRVLAALALGMVLWLGLADGSAAEGQLRILAFGDSLTAGYGLAAADSFPSQLEQALRAEGATVEVVNAGVSGDTTAGGLARLDWALGANSDQGPDLAIVELGANDALRGLAPDAAYRNLNAILDRLRAAKVDVLLTGMRAPPNLGREYETEFNQIFPRLAEDHGVLFYPFFLDGVAGEPSLLQDDGMHPNAAGVAAIVRAITPYVLRLIAARG